MSARDRVMTYSEYNHVIYTIRSSIRNQFHMPRSRTQQKQLTSSLVSAPLIPSDTCTLILMMSIFLFLVFSHPRLLPEKYRTEWSAFEVNLVFIWRNFRGWWDYSYVSICGERHNALTETGSMSLDSIIMCINRNVIMVIRLSVSSDWDMFGNQWEMKGNRDKELRERPTYSVLNRTSMCQASIIMAIL